MSKDISGSTEYTDPSQSHNKIFYGYNEEEIDNYINEMVNRSLDKLFPETVNQYPLNTDSKLYLKNTPVKTHNSITLRLFPKVTFPKKLNLSPNIQTNSSIILRLNKVNILTDEFDPDLWKKFYPLNDPFFNYDYGLSLSDANLQERNNKNPNIIETYEGQVNEKGEKHGLGKLTSDNKTLIGHWREGQFTGWGREVNNNGEIYEGKFVNGNLYGKGIYINGKEYYLGEFRNKKMLGFGEIFSDEYHYYGQLWNKIPNGKGKIHIYKEGTYEGDFENGEIDGSGVFKWNNGNYYIGEIKKGKLHGYGKLVHRNGMVEKGYFNEGQFIKQIDSD